VDEGSFTKAAYLLGGKTSSMSKAITRLEADMGIKLIVRTTRSLGLTDAGRQFYEESNRILYQLKNLQDSLISQRTTPTGNLKVTATVAIGQYFLGPLVPRFMRQHPDISVELILTDQIIDYRAHNIDVAFRSTEKLADSSMFSIKIASQRRIVVASPDYLERNGFVNNPTELEQHSSVLYRAGKLFDRWQFSKEGESTGVKMTPALISNNYATVLEVTKSGVGVANLFDYLIEDDLKAGKLVSMLDSYHQKDQNIFILYSQSRKVSPKLDVFLSFVEREKLSDSH